VGLVRAVNCGKIAGIFNQSKVFRESDYTTPPVPAHASFPSVGIVIDHPEICRFVSFQQDKAVSPDPKTSVTKLCNGFGIFFGEQIAAVVHQDEIVSGGLIFEKRASHRPKDTF
jgi:hypothetical protein